MPVNVPVPEPIPGIPGTDVPVKSPPIIVPPGTGIPPEVNEPPPSEPMFPIREPMIPSLPQVV
jgi:hypothetical protein